MPQQTPQTPGSLTHFPYGVAQGAHQLLGTADAIVLKGRTNLINGPMTAITTATLGSGGTGYAANDTGTIVQSGGVNATYKVLTVSSGAVVTFSITNGGEGYSVANGVATKTGGAQPGVGTGFTINITAVGQAIDLMTLAAPLPVGAPLETASENGNGLDGLTITIIDAVGAAHTITTPANLLNGHLHIVTFNGTKGSNVTLMAFQGVWYAIGANGVTLS